jgi:beta-lactam-binding protein with PASTA domain
VALQLGTNVIDVMASASGKAPAFTAVRVTREQLVRIPDLAGATPDDARAELSDLGLRARVRRKGGFLEGLVPRDARVCQTRPESGAKVVRGSVVEVIAGKLC